jgi:invasion protein IalB
MDLTEDTKSNSFSIVAHIFVAAGTCLPTRCLAAASLLAPLLRLVKGNTETHPQQNDLINIQNKENRLKTAI